MNKYNAKKYSRYKELISMENEGLIKSLQLQVPFELAPAVELDGEPRKEPALRYFADFVYFDKAGNKIVEDAKGYKTKDFRIKLHLMATVHGIKVKIV